MKLSLETETETEADRTHVSPWLSSKCEQTFGLISSCITHVNLTNGGRSPINVSYRNDTTVNLIVNYVESDDYAARSLFVVCNILHTSYVTWVFKFRHLLLNDGQTLNAKRFCCSIMGYYFNCCVLHMFKQVYS